MENQKQNIEDTSTEDLALSLNRQYQTLMQCQNNILIINQIIEKRKNERPNPE